MKQADAAPNSEPPLCEKCGERHYGRTHPFRALRKDRGEADVSDPATQGSAAPVMDFPEAWAFVKATDPGDHHERCSWRTTNGALLCDCDVIWDEYVRRGGSDPRVRT